MSSEGWTFRKRQLRFKFSREGKQKEKKKKTRSEKGDGQSRAQLFDFESGLCIIQRELKLFPIRAWISGTVLHRALCLRLVENERRESVPRGNN